MPFSRPLIASLVGIRLVSIIAESRDQAGDERRARRQLLDDDVLMERVRAVAERTQPVERWDAKRRGEVPVGGAAGRALRRARAPWLPRPRAPARRARATPAVRSIGGRLIPPVTSARTRGSAGRERRIACSIAAGVCAAG